MSFYAKLIRASIEEAGRDDRTDDATVQAVEQVMRSWWTSLDWLTPGEFRLAVWIALADVDGLNSQGALADWCEAYELPVPSWAATR